MWNKIGKYGNTKNCAKKIPGNLDKKSLDKNDPYNLYTNTDVWGEPLHAPRPTPLYTYLIASRRPRESLASEDISSLRRFRMHLTHGRGVNWYSFVVFMYLGRGG